MKLNVSQEAVDALKAVLKERQETTKSIRVNVAGFGWGGPRLGLVLDEQKENDEVFEKEGLNFLVGEELKNYPGFTVEYSNSFLRKGFAIDIMGYSGGGC